MSNDAGPDESDAPPRFWVGIGASAGGLEALRALVRQLPAALPATYLVAQHMAPHQKSLLTEIIGRETALPVLEAGDGLAPRADTIYITPPNSNVVVADRRVRLEPPSERPGAPKPSVNALFESLAAELGPHAIGIVLSGTGSDGAKGVRAIRARGGITVAQDEHTAKYTGMPTAAQESGAVDLVLSPEELGTQFHLLLGSPRNLAALRREPLTGRAMERLNELLLLQTKVDFRHYKSATVQRRVERRMVATGADDIEEYVAIASDSSAEVDELFKDLLITVTSFFRDPEEFEALARHVERIVRVRAEAPLRVWVAGVATGEEAYTLAILFAEALGGPKAFADADLQIFATDIDAEAIAVARRGVYPETALAAMSEERAGTWFDPHGGGFAVRKPLREKVVFSVHDVARDPPFLKLDLVSCRNLLIYFRTELQAHVFDRFHYALKDEAVLFLGKSEAVSASLALFRPAAPDKHIFFQKSSHRRKLVEQAFPDRLGRIPRAERAPAPRPAPDGAASRLDSLLGALGPDSLLVGADSRILRVRGDLDGFVGLSAKTGVDTTAMSLLREPWSQDVRIGASVALRNMSVHEGVARPTPHRPGHLSRVTAYPMHDAIKDEKTALVVFRTWHDARDAEDADGGDGDGASNDAGALGALARELELARANLQITSEQLETSNEELQSINEEMQSTNEELQSTNEELQSTNEELETSSEELQSTNEELSTVNDELQVSSQLLAATVQRQRSILDNVVTPMIVVDTRLAVVDASLSSAATFGVPDDVAEPPLSRCRPAPGLPPLERLVGDALESRSRRTAQVEADGVSATLSVAPYHGPDGELQGAIVQLQDSTEALRRAVAELGLIFAHVPVSLALCDARGEVVAANANAHRWLGLEEPALVGRDAHAHLPAAIAERLRGLDRGALASGDTASGDVYTLEIDGLEPKWVRTTHVPFAHGDPGESMLLLMSEDLTRQHEEERRTEYYRTRMELALEASDIGLWDHRIERDESFWSARFRSILGLADDVPPGTAGFMRRVHPDDRERAEATVATAVRSGEPYSVRLRIVPDGGDTRWVTIRGRRIEDEEEGRKLVGTLIDETELVAQLERLGAQNNHLQLAERLSETGYWQLDLDGDRTLMWSDQVYAIHGLDPAAYVPTVEDALDFYHPEDHARVSALVADAIANTTGFEFTARVRHADGEYRRVKALGVAQRDDTTGTARLFGVFMDVTELTARERSLSEARDELARSNAELSRFSYVCSHDMKEPVRLIEMMATLLLDENSSSQSEQTRELLTRVKTNTGRLRAIIDGLLAYSRVEARVETGPVDLARVAHEIREAFALRIAERNAELVIGELPSVHGARVHFVQLIQNLVGNALAYTDVERPVVRVGARRGEDGVELVVEDNGPGIPETDRARIFDVFSRLELDSSVEGTGLGLSICQRIVHQYGGTIACTESALGGAAFVIRLPQA